MNTYLQAEGPLLIRDIGHPHLVKGSRGVLYLNGGAVGNVVVQGWDASWTYGIFVPSQGFEKFAAMFGRWSLLMHEDENRPIDNDLAYELREAERMMDSVHARVYFPNEESWHEVRQVNIDGTLIEWKEF